MAKTEAAPASMSTADALNAVTVVANQHRAFLHFEGLLTTLAATEQRQRELDKLNADAKTQLEETYATSKSAKDAMQEALRARDVARDAVKEEDKQTAKAVQRAKDGAAAAAHAAAAEAAKASTAAHATIAVAEQNAARAIAEIDAKTKQTIAGFEDEIHAKQAELDEIEDRLAGARAARDKLKAQLA